MDERLNCGHDSNYFNSSGTLGNIGQLFEILNHVKTTSQFAFIIDFSFLVCPSCCYTLNGSLEFGHLKEYYSTRPNSLRKERRLLMDFSTDDSLISEFLAESREHLDSIEPDLVILKNDGRLARENISRIFHPIHNIKESAGFLGLDSITQLTSLLENSLMEIREGRIELDQRTVDLLLPGLDKLRLMIVNFESDEEVDFTEEIDGLRAMLNSDGHAARDDGSACSMNKEENAPLAEVGLGALKLKIFSEYEPDGVIFRLDPEKTADAASGGACFYALWVGLSADLSPKGRSSDEMMEQVDSLGEIMASDLMEVEASGKDGANGRILLASIMDESYQVEQALDLSPSRVVPVSNEILEAAFEELGADENESEALTDLTPTSDPPPESVVPVNLHGEPSIGRVENPYNDASPPKAAQIQETVRVSVSLIDRMMNLAGELVLGRNQLKRLLENRLSQAGGLASIMQNVDIVTTDIQEQIMQLRMQPVGNVLGKFPRVVMDLSRQLHKEVELAVEGGEVELDKSILEALSDPLTHLIRNCIDHGLEKPEERAAAGKPLVGLVSLKAFHEEGQVNITVADDGRGINVEKVVKKAITNGLIDSFSASRMTETEKLGLIFTPGFSTAEAVTDVSGRGVGMDVVRTNIEKIGGRLEISSVPGRGTTVRLRLPLTLAIVPSLVVRASGAYFAIPQMDVQELVCIQVRDSSKRIERIGEADVLRLRGRLLPLIRLADALGLESYYTDPDTGERKHERRKRLADRRRKSRGLSESIAKLQKKLEIFPQAGSVEQTPRRGGDDRRKNRAGDVFVAVLKVGVNRYGLLVDELLNNEEIVVKPLSRHIKDVKCFSGTTIMGDGRVAMILSAAGIANVAQLRFSEVREEDRRRGDSLEKAGKRESEKESGIVLFNNSTREYFAISMTKVSRLEKIDRSAVKSIGGREFINYRESVLPLIRLENYLPVGPPPEDSGELFLIIPRTEGSRMAGIMASRIVDVFDTNATVQPELKKRPGVMGAGVVEENLTLFIDVDELLEMALSGDYGDRLPDHETPGNAEVG